MRPKLCLPHSIYPLLLCSLLLSCTHAARAQTTPSPSFEVATIKAAQPGTDKNTGSWNHPGTGRFIATHLSLTVLIELAYDIDDSQIANKPGWLDTNLYDIDAKAEEGVPLTRDELRPRLKNLLQERFHLTIHTETRSIRGYALVIAKGGEHLILTKKPDFRGDFYDVSPGQMRGFHWTMAQFAKYLSRAEGFAVVDETSIAGRYDVDFSYNPKPDDTSSDLPALNEALEQATGLQLKERKVPVETIVIDSVEKTPTDN
jgi:uncharacterized protein (TIGR03435 family)